jgi:hypothetical protein
MARSRENVTSTTLRFEADAVGTLSKFSPNELESLRHCKGTPIYFAQNSCTSQVNNVEGMPLQHLGLSELV